MNYKMIGRFISMTLAIEAAFMLPALVMSFFDENRGVSRAYLYSIGLILLIAGLLYLICRNAQRRFYAREGLVCVSLSWMMMSLLGCLPYFLSGQIPSYINALFETVSGFTTTGATILSDVESMSKSLVYWRSFTQWIGGMGVLVFLLAIVPATGKHGGFTMHLLRAESPGPNVGKLVPKMRQTALILYVIYILMTIVDAIFLLAGGMSLFDAVCTALATAGTGGFGPKNNSMAGYSPYLQNVTTVFMLLFGVNFTCYYMLLIKQVKAVFKDEELHVYIGVIAASIILISVNIRGLYDTLGETIRHAAFQVVSIITTSGFATTDYDMWPSFSRAIIMFLMVIGGCAGSTSGGFKCGRALLVFKSLHRNIRKVLNPQKIQVVRNNSAMVSEKVVDTTNAYLAAYIVIIMSSFIVVCLDNFSLMTNFIAVVSCFNNVGPGLEGVGPTCNYGDFSILSKIILILDMLAGRLEIFPILILASRSTWKQR